MATKSTGKIEQPLRKLVKLLRDNGFDTFCSCGHLPHPYIQIKWSANFAIHKIFYLLLDNGYKNYTIKDIWDSRTDSRFLEIVFNPLLPLTKLKDIKNNQKISWLTKVGNKYLINRKKKRKKISFIGKIKNG